MLQCYGAAAVRAGNGPRSATRSRRAGSRKSRPSQYLSKGKSPQPVPFQGICRYLDEFKTCWINYLHKVITMDGAGTALAP